MRAIHKTSYGSPDVLSLVDLDKPQPTGDQVRVEVKAASLNTADLDHLRGIPRAGRIGVGLREPKHPGVGLDVAGTVEAVGPDVTGFQPGDQVWADLFQYGHGAFSEYVCLPEKAFTPKPARRRAGSGQARRCRPQHRGDRRCRDPLARCGP